MIHDEGSAPGIGCGSASCFTTPAGALMPTVKKLEVAAVTAPTALTKDQKRAFWAAWGGWTMDGMDSFILSLVLVPALRDVLPKSGIAATTGNVGYYGGLL